MCLCVYVFVTFWSYGSMGLQSHVILFIRTCDGGKMSYGFICCSFARDKHILLLSWSYSKPGEVGLIS
nr:MAG TPA: hypothetical protein [Caudoviricetes sp.]